MRIRQLAELIVIVAFSFLGLWGCGTMSKRDCGSVNWEKIGLIDGRMGRSSDYIQRHIVTCGNDLPNRETYEIGRKLGVVDYCTPGSVYREGSDGRPLADVCPTEIIKELRDHHSEGLKTYDLKAERVRVEKERAEKREAAHKDNTFVGEISKAYSLVSGTSPTEREERRIEDLSDQILVRDSEAPRGGASVPRFEDRLKSDPVSIVPNMLSVMVGSIYGFGLGHTIQGTYRESGWKWTAIDIGNIVGLGAVSRNCGNQGPNDRASTSQDSTVCAVAGLSLFLGIIVSRVWQGIELAEGSATSFSPYTSTHYQESNNSGLLVVWDW